MKMAGKQKTSGKSRLATDQVGYWRYSNLSRFMKQSVSGAGIGLNRTKTGPFMPGIYEAKGTKRAHL